MEFFKANIIPSEVLVQLIAFVIVFWTLKIFAWKPILKALEARRQRIEGDFARVDQLKKDVEKLKAEYNAHIQKIDEEARTRIQEAVADGQRISREIQEKARADAQSTLEKTKQNLSIEAAKIRLDLKREIANMAIQVSEKILAEKLNEAKQQDKILKIIDDLEAEINRQGGSR